MIRFVNDPPLPHQDNIHKIQYHMAYRLSMSSNLLLGGQIKLLQCARRFVFRITIKLNRKAQINAPCESKYWN